ncbi:tRNA (adenine57/58-N1)-methyltransferase [hydrothermal vent metagenome]|uniref:tRNA (Adenine57/58-N1)-methyltransferase n=1 Tax=hydrothermal vent metagenome TaxID=652676 RepID=A0A3B0W7P9_9ZZZZ
MNSKEHWKNVYQNKSAEEVSWYQAIPTISLSIIRDSGLKKEQAIIDVGGGASTLVDSLLQEGFEDITVLDLSSQALEVAKQRLGERAEAVDWLAEDITQFSPKKKVFFWHDRAVFHFLTQSEDRAKYKKILASSVLSGGYVMIAVFSIGGPEQCSGLDIVQYDADKIKEALGVEFKLIDEQVEQHMTPSGNAQLFRYFVFRKVESAE